MKLSWRKASPADLPLLAEWNYQLIRDEGHRNPMTVPDLKSRMRGWLAADYQAIIFATAEPVAYALFRPEQTSIYLRQFFVRRDHRRQGIGRAGMNLLRSEIWPRDVRLTVEVLCENPSGIAFWRSMGYSDYSLTLEIMP